MVRYKYILLLRETKKRNITPPKKDLSTVFFIADDPGEHTEKRKRGHNPRKGQNEKQIGADVISARIEGMNGVLSSTIFTWF